MLFACSNNNDSFDETQTDFAPVQEQINCEPVQKCEDSSDKTSCYAELEDPCLCNFASSESRCLTKIAYRTANKEICPDVNCENRFDFIDQNKYDCTKTTTSSFQETFYKDAALITRDSCWCKSIDNGVLKSGCYIDLARLTQDATLCNNLEGYTQKACLNNIN